LHYEMTSQLVHNASPDVQHISTDCESKQLGIVFAVRASFEAITLVKASENSTTSTPMVRQYQELKSQHPGTLLFFRLGDFYELFFDDAVIGARELQITLTARHKERGDAIPMCGVPHHSAANYIAKLVRKGYRVAICEQTEDLPKPKSWCGVKLSGSLRPARLDPQLLEPRESTFLAAVCARGESVGAAFWIFRRVNFALPSPRQRIMERIAADIESYAPRELLFPLHSRLWCAQDSPINPKPKCCLATEPSINDEPTAGSLNATLTPLDDWLWQTEDGESLLIKHFGVRSLDGFGPHRQVGSNHCRRSLLALRTRNSTCRRRTHRRHHLLRTSGPPGARSDHRAES
jgi:DNA mismatch repair protein MutS